MKKTRDLDMIGSECDHCGNRNLLELVEMGNPGDFPDREIPNQPKFFANGFPYPAPKFKATIVVPKICKPHCGCQKEYADESTLFQWGMFFKGASVTDIPMAMLCTLMIVSWDTVITPGIAAISPAGVGAAYLISMIIHFMVLLLAVSMWMITGIPFLISVLTVIGLTMWAWR